MSDPPEPIFTFFGVDGGATCLCVSSESGDDEKGRLFVGSQRGAVRRYGLKSKIMEENVYIDPEERRIISIQYHRQHLFVHVRAYAIVQLKYPDRSKSTVEPWETVRIFETTHIGFCNSILLGSQLLFVSTDFVRCATLCVTSIDAESGDNVKSTQILQTPDVMPMCMVVGEEKESEVLIGMEDGQLAISYGNEKTGDFSYMATQKLGNDPIFCLASCSKWVAAGCAKSPIHIVDRENLSVQKIAYPEEASGCASIMFSPNDKQILAGFVDGSIRVFSRSKLTILLSLSGYHDANITSVLWLPPEDDQLVIAASSDETVTIWKLK